MREEIIARLDHMNGWLDKAFVSAPLAACTSPAEMTPDPAVVIRPGTFIVASGNSVEIGTADEAAALPGSS